MSAENSDSAVEQVATIGWADFDRVDLRIGTIVHAEPFPEARRPAIRMQIDFGPELGILKSSAQITERYTPDSLIDRQVVAVVNLPPKQIGPMRSECLVTGFHDENGAVVLCVPDAEVPPGTRLR
jgi:tRNA-binding protein